MVRAQWRVNARASADWPEPRLERTAIRTIPYPIHTLLRRADYCLVAETSELVTGPVPASVCPHHPQLPGSSALPGGEDRLTSLRVQGTKGDTSQMSLCVPCRERCHCACRGPQSDVRCGHAAQV